MKKNFFNLVPALVLLFLAAGCVTTSSERLPEKSVAVKTDSESAAIKNKWVKLVSDGRTYFFLFSDSAQSEGIRNDVTINRGLTIMCVLTPENFAIKSFGSITTESYEGKSQTFSLNEAGWKKFCSKNSKALVKLSSVPAQLKAENSAKYVNLTAKTQDELNWKKILENYLEGNL